MSRRALGILIVVAACETVESENIRTEGIYASYSAVSDGDGSTALSATLYLEDPGFDYIDLEGDDELVAWQGGTQRRMAEQDFLNVVSYHADFDGEEESTVFRIELLRTVDKSARNSTVSLPAPFSLGPTPTSASRAEGLTVSWSPSSADDPMRWSAQGECIEPASGALDEDTGSLVIAPNTLIKRTPSDPNDPTMAVPDSCQVTVTINRTRQGSVDAAFEEGGSFTATQVRSTQLTSTL